jgi:hydrogenase/urease accessory protein HupE
VSVCVIGVVAGRARGADWSAFPCSFVPVYVLGVFVSVCGSGVFVLSVWIRSVCAQCVDQECLC